MPIQYRVVQRLLGYLLTFFSLGMLPSLALSLTLDDGEAFSFLYAFFLLFLLGTALWVQAAHHAPRRQPLRLRDGFVVVSLFWIGLGLAGSIPLYISPSLQLSGTDAVFEAVSGLTTTGATVLSGLDDMPASILFYRQFLQWIGGLGIIVLAVAILPLVGMGGVQLYQAEAPHSLAERRLTPRITETAKVLLYLYSALTLACGLAYWGAGMSPLDAICHAFSTVAIGGFSTHDANIGYFDSALIEMIAIIFMIMAGANFGLHYLALSRRSLQPYSRNGEFRTYAVVLTSVGAICIGYLLATSFYSDPLETVRHGLFQTVSIATTTGYTTTGYNHWPAFVSTLLLLASFIGGCVGSTGGGMKVIRFLLMVKHSGKELYRIIHPTVQVTVRVGDRVMSQSALQSVWGFFAAYITTFTVLFLLLMMTGLDQVSAFSAVGATLNNLGPGLGEVSQNYASVSDFGKWLLCASMVFGRLEVFTLLVILTPAFWRR